MTRDWTRDGDGPVNLTHQVTTVDGVFVREARGAMNAGTNDPRGTSEKWQVGTFHFREWL